MQLEIVRGDLGADADGRGEVDSLEGVLFVVFCVGERSVQFLGRDSRDYLAVVVGDDAFLVGLRLAAGSTSGSLLLVVDDIVVVVIVSRGFVEPAESCL